MLQLVTKSIQDIVLQAACYSNVNLFHCRVPTILTTALWYIPLVKY